MANKTNYLEAAMLNAVLRATSYSTPSDVYVGLFTTAPTDAYTSAIPTGVEVSGNAYQRRVATWAVPAGSPRVSTNDATITFPTAAPATWGIVVAFGIFDASTSGNLLYWNTLTSNIDVAAGYQVLFDIGALSIGEE